MSGKGNGGPYSVISSKGPNGRGPAVAALPPNAVSMGAMVVPRRKMANANLHPPIRVAAPPNHVAINVKPGPFPMAKYLQNMKNGKSPYMFPPVTQVPRFIRTKVPSEIVVHKSRKNRKNRKNRKTRR